MMKTKVGNYAPSPLIQKLFIAVGAGAYLAQAINSVLLFVQVYPEQWRISPFTFFVLNDILLPPVLFALAFFLLRMKASLLQRIFMSGFLAVTGLLAQLALGQLVQGLMEILVRVGVYMDVASWYMFIPLVGMLAGYLALLWFLRRRTLTAPAIPVSLQRVYLTSFVLAFALITASTAYFVLRQYPSNPNLSGFLTTFLQATVLPIILLGVAYLINPGKWVGRARVFEGALLTTMGLLLFLVVMYVGQYLERAGGDAAGINSRWFSVGTVALSAIIYAVVLATIRRR